MTNPPHFPPSVRMCQRLAGAGGAPDRGADGGRHVRPARDDDRGGDQFHRDRPQHQRAGQGLTAQVRVGRQAGQERDRGQVEQRPVVGRDREAGDGRGQQVGAPAPGRGPDHDPGRQREQAERRGIVGGQPPGEDRSLGHAEQAGRAQRDPLVEQPAGHRVQQRGGGQHRHEADRPCGREPAEAVGGGGEHRVEHRGAGKVGGVGALQRRAVQQVRYLQVTGVQVQRLVAEGRVPQPQRQDRLHAEDQRQHRSADPGPAGAGRTPLGRPRALPARQREHPGAHARFARPRPGRPRRPGRPGRRARPGALGRKPPCRKPPCQKPPCRKPPRRKPPRRTAPRRAVSRREAGGRARA